MRQRNPPGLNRMLKKATSGVLTRSALLTYRSTLRGLRSLGPCRMAFLSILLFSRGFLTIGTLVRQALKALLRNLLILGVVFKPITSTDH
jgi:hypothetical protein